MKPRIGFASSALSLILAAAAVGCSSSDDSTATGPKKLEVYSWLVSGAEGTALENLFGVLRDNVPGIEILNAAQGRSDEARKELPMRMAAGNPPDSFQAIGGADLLEWQKKGSLEPLDTLADQQGWREAFGEGVLKSVTGPDNHIYGVPLNLERDNTLFYNKDVLAAAGVSPSDLSTVDGWFAAAEKIKAANVPNLVAPLAVSASGGWTIASHVFEALLVAEGGADYYLNYMSGSMADPADATMIKTLTDVAHMMDYANADRATTGWGAAVKMVCDGTAGMIFLPDFTKGQFQQIGCGTAAKPNIDYVSMEKAGEPTFVYVGITFPVTAGAPHHDMAIEFAKAVGSKAGQEAFNPVKGSVAARKDVDPTKFDAISARTVADLGAAAKVVPGYAALSAGAYQEQVNPALQAFVDPSNAAFGKVDSLAAVLRAQYANIKP
jgi:glucose/mannose transport system substrate-binding protein